MRRYEVIKMLLSYFSKRHLAVFTTGMTSREAFCIDDRNENFYMIGSMGLASSFALGIALNTKKNIVIFDGDGSALMEMGNLALIGCYRPKNLVHIVLDNESYQSTGGQPTIAKKVSLVDIARAAGYIRVSKITTPAGLKKISSWFDQEGPSFILIKLDKKGPDGIGRVTRSPENIKDRFKTALLKGA